MWRRRRVQAAEVGLHDLLQCEESEKFNEIFEDISINAEMANAMRRDFNRARILSELWRHDARLERSTFRSLKELQRRKDLRPDQPDPVGPAIPEPEQQKQQEQTQITKTTPESNTSNGRPIQAAPLTATATAATECAHKHFLSKSPIAFGRDLS